MFLAGVKFRLVRTVPILVKLMYKHYQHEESVIARHPVGGHVFQATHEIDNSQVPGEEQSRQSDSFPERVMIARG